MTYVETEVEVRYQETDQMGIVYHGNYLVWFEIGRTKFVNNLGLKYLELEGMGYLSPVIDIQIKYRKAVTYGQTVKVRTYLKDYDGIRTTYAYEIYDEHNDLAVTGTSVHVLVRKDNFTPVLMRKVYPGWHQTFLDEYMKDQKE